MSWHCLPATTARRRSLDPPAPCRGDAGRRRGNRTTQVTVEMFNSAQRSLDVALEPIRALVGTHQDQLAVVDTLAAIYVRHRTSTEEPGDRFAAQRNMLRLIARCPLHDLVAAVLEMSRLDDDARSAFQVILQARKPSQAMKEGAKRRKKQLSNLQIRSRDERLYERVLAHRSRTRTSLDKAFADVAECRDEGSYIDGITGSVVSPAVVRAAYMKCTSANTASDYYTTGSAFGGRMAKPYLPGSLRSKGRPRK